MSVISRDNFDICSMFRTCKTSSGYDSNPSELSTTGTSFEYSNVGEKSPKSSITPSDSASKNNAPCPRQSISIRPSWSCLNRPAIG
ncbi:hypothetical protein Hanom_Chr05g00463951 [Helianthus anomalus]